jgi:hypothetical protein
VTSAKDGAGWLAFFGYSVARGLTGVVLVTSDAYPVWWLRSAPPCRAARRR